MVFIFSAQLAYCITMRSSLIKYVIGIILIIISESQVVSHYRTTIPNSFDQPASFIIKIYFTAHIFGNMYNYSN
jgi:hypothetical protein